MNYPIKVLVLDTVMDRGGAESMMMNYLRNIDRSKIAGRDIGLSPFV